MISIDITGDNANIVWGKLNGKSIVVEGYVTEPIEVFVTDEGVSDIVKFSGALNRMLTDNQVKGKEISIQFTSSNIVSNEITLPYQAKETLMINMIKGELSQIMSGEDFILDYCISDIFEEKKTKKCKAMVYLSKKSVVEDLHRVISLMNKVPSVYGIAENSIYSLANHGTDFYESGTVLCCLNESDVKIHLFGEPGSRMTRYGAMTKALPGMNTALIDESGSIIGLAVQHISKMIQFQSVRQPDKPVTKVYIFGDIADGSLADLLSSSLDIPVYILPMPSLVSAPDDFDFPRYAYAVGGLI